MPKQENDYIDINDIPKVQLYKGKTNAIENMIKEIPIGKAKALTDNKPFKIATIRSYIDKQHKEGKLKEFNVIQRSTHQGEKKLITLYITHEKKE